MFTAREVHQKNLLYYLAPDIELGDPDFRYGSYKSILKPEISSLLDAREDFSVSMILSKHIYEKAARNGLLDERIVYLIDAEEKISRNDAWYHGTYSPEDLDKEKIRLKELTGDHYQPDIVIVYEKPSAFLRECFPSAVVIDVMFGCFSRPPYPTLGAYDPIGLYDHSFLATNAQRIRNLAANEDELRFLKEVRRQAGHAIAEFQPYKQKIAEIRQKFSKIVLVACQVDGYFAVTSTSGYDTQYDMVLDICSNVSCDIGIIVTQHAYSPALNAQQVEALEKEFPHFIPFDNDKNVPDASQFIVPYVDALATVSSSLAFQAALWHVPVIAMGQAHINIIAAGHGASGIEPLARKGLSEADTVITDNAISFLLIKYNLLYRSSVFDGERYAELLIEMFESFQKDPTGTAYFFERTVDLAALGSAWNSAFTKYKLREWATQHGHKPQTDYLLMELCAHRVATFDLFDTILQRPIIAPHETFLIMEPAVQKYLHNRNYAFHRFRREAEADVRRPTKGEYEVLLEDIYRKMAANTGITTAQALHIMEMEMRYELQLCSVKPKLFLYHKFATLLCDKVGIVSDFYIEQDFIEALIAKNGITVDFLYVSATSKTRKHNGTLFPQIKNDLSEMGYSPNDIIHIGDNRIADKEMAERNGIRGYHFPKATENLRRSLLGKVFAPAFKEGGLGSSIIFGLFANRFYGTSWNQIDTASMFRGDPFLLGYIGYGPLIVGFCQWLHREVKIKGYDKLFFLARDGHIVKEVYEKLYGQSENNIYLYSSRRAATVASLRTVDEIIELAHQSFNAQPLNDFLSNRFGFELNDTHSDILVADSLTKTSIISPAADMGRLVSVLTALADEILANAREERTAYLEYLDTVGFTQSAKQGNTAVIDIGYSGTMQYYLMRLLPSTKIGGLYMLTHQHARHFFDDVELSGYLASFDDHRLAYRHKLNDHVFIFEAGLSAMEGSLLRFTTTERGISVPEFIEADAEENRKKTLSRIHAGVVEFSKDYGKNLGAYVDVVALSPLLAEKILVHFAEKPSAVDAQIFYGNEVENLFGGGSVCLIEPSGILSKSSNIRHEQIEEMIRRSKWKQGAKALYEDRRVADTKASTLKASKTLSKQIKNRKMAKLINNPYLFFTDSKKPLLRPLRHGFGNNAVGEINKKILRFFLDKR